MNKLSKYKKGIGNIIIILGIMLIAFSLYFNMQLKASQERMLKEYSESIEEEPVIYLDENHTSEKETKEQEYNIDRSGITDLKMIIQIPKLDIEAAVVNGTTREYLKMGPGLYEISPLPGDEDSNVLIAAHRDTYGAWFRNVDKLVNGDDVILKFEGKNYNYKVEKVFIIEKNDWSVTEPQGYSALTLTSCYPLHSSKQRIVVRCMLDNVVDE